MYLDYWEIKEKPFENTPDPRFFFQSKQHREALMRILYAVHEAKGAALLTGEYGCGKTTLIRTVINELDQHLFPVVLLTNPRWGADEMLQEILYQFGTDKPPDKKTEILRLINDQLFNYVREGKHTVLFVDEAQIIEDPMTLEELRLLLNFQLNDRFMLTLVISGQPELRDRMRQLPQFVQRIAVKYHLVALSFEETSEYIEYRLALAGNLRETVFTENAIADIFSYTGGTPRKINNLCDLALAIGAGSKVAEIDSDLIKSIVNSETAGGAFQW
ncbi:MAG: AAA family ATPase [Candidatus Electryonea clarkiae]|nr:AAA family ATPase [Candidatus Electryonea clarkiae]MDP8286323.1 AAA family ATPase [Candidatus Electryonea clarkiae]